MQYKKESFKTQNTNYFALLQ